MPVAVPDLGSFDYVPETQEDLDWADLVTLDFSLYGTPEGNQQLAGRLIEAIRVNGFFYLKNFGVSQARVDRQFAIGRQFYELPLEEKLQYVPEGLDNGVFNGYVPAGRRILDPVSDLRDRVEIYNVPKFTSDFNHKHPAIVQQHLPEIEDFVRSLHTEVLNPLHTLLAIALELPEDYFVNMHEYGVKSEDHLRYMKYSKYTPEENKLIGSQWFDGHTDLGSWTLLFRQPVAALQIKVPTTGEWKWVKPQDGMLTVNAGEALTFLTGGYVQSTIHRVASPPKDQEHVDRLGLLYFARPHNDIRLSSLKTPVLQREGCTENVFEKSGSPVPTMEEWTFARQKWGRTRDAVRGDPSFENAQILPGWRERVYA